MNEMILKMFQYAKMESNGFELKLQNMDVCAVLRSVIAERYTEIEKHNIKLEVDIPETPVMVALDAAEFPRVINNLVSNAIKHNEDGIKLSISIARNQEMAGRLEYSQRNHRKGDRGGIKIKVADSGTVISDDVQECIFRPFQCSDASRISKDGSGLGFAITKRIVELHYGKIYIDNQMSKYTRAFVIELPA